MCSAAIGIPVAEFSIEERESAFNCIVLIHIIITPLTARAFQKRPRPQLLTLCRSLHAEALQEIASERLAQGPYVAARAEFEPATLRSRGIDSTNAPPRPDNLIVWRLSRFK